MPKAYLARFFIILPALAMVHGAPLWASGLEAQFKPLTETLYDPIDLDSVSADVKTPIEDWQARVKNTNAALAADIMASTLGTIEVNVHDRDAILDTIKPFVEAARKQAARWGANQLFLEDAAVDADTGHWVQLTFIAYRVVYKDWLIPPSYLEALPYNPLPDYFVAQKLQEWNTQHFGKTKIYFGERDRKARQNDVLSFMTRLKEGTPIRVVLQDGSNLRGAYTGLDQDDQVWIRPAGLGGFISHRSVRSQDIETVGILN